MYFFKPTAGLYQDMHKIQALASELSRLNPVDFSQLFSPVPPNDLQPFTPRYPKGPYLSRVLNKNILIIYRCSVP